MKSTLSRAVVITLFAVLLMSQNAWAMDCTSTHITLASQGAVDNFQATYGGGGVCDNVTGNLTVQGNSISNVDGLADLVNVGGHLIIHANVVLTDVDGLAGMINVGGELRVSFNDILGDVDGLANIVSVGNNLYLSHNYFLTDLDGLASLTNVSGNVFINRNDELNNVDGLAKLNSVGEYFQLTSNAELTDVDGLSDLTNVGGRVVIRSNIALSNLDGLAKLTSIGDYFEIETNPALANLNGLIGLTSIGSYLRIKENAGLGDCSGLAALLGWPDGPPVDGIGGAISIRLNQLGCNSVQQVLDSVSGPTAPIIDSAVTFDDQAILGFLAATTTDALWPITDYYGECVAQNPGIFENSTITQIPDDSSVISKLMVIGMPFNHAAGLAIPVNITHSRTRHLTLTLTSPNGTAVMLWNEEGGSDTDLIGTFPTTLEPTESLDAFDGEDFNGEWQLTVADGVATQTGTLNSWGITVGDKVTAMSATSPITLLDIAELQPYMCTVAAITGLGIGPESNVVEVDTTPRYSLGGDVDGLEGSGLVLQNNAGDDLAINSDGGFTFAMTVKDGTDYAVTVKTQPTNLSQTCVVTNGSGTMTASDVSNVEVTCTTDTFAVGGNVAGLEGTGLVLQNNAGDDLPIGSDGSFDFVMVQIDGTDYAVTIASQPERPNQTCSVSNGSGTLAGSNVTDVAVTCVTDTFTVGGSVSGLAGSGLVLQNNAGDDLAIGSDGDFTFATPIDDGSGYTVTVKTQPADLSQLCDVSNGNGTLMASDVTSVVVTCVTRVNELFFDGFEDEL